jgi:hypothetical protein
MNRVINADLERVVTRLNRSNGIENPAWNVIGSYHIGRAYGGVRLEQITNESGGIRVITSGYTTKRECLAEMQAYANGKGA